MLIVITLPDFFDGEAEHIVRLLRSSVDLVHLRKPHSTAAQMERLILAIPALYRPRLVLHVHHSLAVKYALYGVHLNSRNPAPPAGWRGSVSRSCHSLEEVKTWKDKCDYVSLSPIFDSISKQNYPSAFSSEQLSEAQAEGIIDEKVMALGGVTFSRMGDVLDMGFGGGMILGDAWKDVSCHAAQQPVALTIAGSDSCAGAGIQQDLKTMSAIGVYGVTVVTAVTSQNTFGVSAAMPLPADVVASQLEAVFSDLNVGAVKLGMIPNAKVAMSVADHLRAYLVQKPECQVVFDPVMVSTSGHRLMDETCVQVVGDQLFPLCTLVTPNLPEAGVLLQHAFAGDADGDDLVRRYGTNFLVKGGHGGGSMLVDMLFMKDGHSASYPTERIDTHNLHGTGCTLSSAIASFLLQGYSLQDAIARAKLLLSRAIIRGRDAKIGKGNGPLLL